MYTKKFWNSLSTWEKVIAYIAMMFFQITRFFIRTAISFARWSWKQMKLGWYWTKIWWKKMTDHIRWLVNTPLGNTYLKRGAIAFFAGALLFGSIFGIIFAQKNTAYVRVDDGYARAHFVEYTVVGGDSWWGIAKEYCPSYMNVGGPDAKLDYLALLRGEEENREISAKDFLNIGDVIIIPVMPE